MGIRRIGIDFDNTIVRYDHVFLNTARQQELVPADFEGNKQTIRDAIRRRPDGETEWQKLQGHVYGVGIKHALLFDGVDLFLKRCRKTNSKIFIVSHKTEFGHFDPDRVNLRQSALDWMTASGFFCAKGFGIPVENVFFASTREEKLARIGSLKCSHFIDDLEEVLSHPDFPDGVARILFAQRGNPVMPEIECHKTWQAISEVVFK
jgi:hypothetical protein